MSAWVGARVSGEGESSLESLPLVCGSPFIWSVQERFWEFRRILYSTCKLLLLGTGKEVVVKICFDIK